MFKAKKVASRKNICEKLERGAKKRKVLFIRKRHILRIVSDLFAPFFGFFIFLHLFSFYNYLCITLFNRKIMHNTMQKKISGKLVSLISMNTCSYCFVLFFQMFNNDYFLFIRFSMIWTVLSGLSFWIIKL